MTEVHYISMIIIGVGSFIFGILPVALSSRTRSYPFLLSLMLCLGAGVLLATSLVHMLTEVQLKLQRYAQLYFCAGFLILYCFDEITHYYMDNKLETQPVIAEHERNQGENGHYGTFDDSQNSPLLGKGSDLASEQNIAHSYSRSKLRCNEGWDEGKGVNENFHSHCLHTKSNDETGIQYSIRFQQPYSSNPVSKTGLLIALFIHSVLEGISIGVQTEFSQIIFILGAVSFHKIVLSFCFGLEVYHQMVKLTHLMFAVFLFSIGSPIGIFLGMTVTSYQKESFGIDAQLQAVAAGSLLYVATFEVMPREREKWKHSAKKAAGIFQLFFVLIGFTFITLFHFFADPVHDSDNKKQYR